MLTDRELSALAPKDKIFKVADRDGLYVAVLPTGTRAFRYDYRLNGRRETLAVGRYDPACKVTRDPEALEFGMGLSLREARTLLDRARRDVERGVSPSLAKVEKRTQAAEAMTFGGWVLSPALFSRGDVTQFCDLTRHIGRIGSPSGAMRKWWRKGSGKDKRPGGAGPSLRGGPSERVVVVRWG